MTGPTNIHGSDVVTSTQGDIVACFVDTECCTGQIARLLGRANSPALPTLPSKPD